MSDGSDSSTPRIHTEPLRRIGAQDLLKVDHSMYGHLRKQGKLKRIFGSRRWDLKFAVVSQGCVYCFNNEHSENPVSAFSLCAYDSVVEANKASMPHSFEIIHEEKGKASQMFACETDEKRREWMNHIEEVLQQCRNYLGKLSADSGIDDDISSRKYRSNLPPLPSVPGEEASGKGARPKVYKAAKSEYDLESEEEEEYDEVNCEPPRERAPSPPRAATLPAQTAGHVRVLPGNTSTLPLQRKGTVSDRPRLPVPPTLGAQPPTPGAQPPRSYVNSNVFSEEEYKFNSNDRDQAFEYLKGRDVGVFLVRNARHGPGNVLTVNTPLGTKEFKITEQGGRVSLDNKEFFPALSALLTFYNQNNLPKSEYTAKLERGYKSMS